MKKHKILIIEDEIIVAADIEDMLTFAGYYVPCIASTFEQVKKCIAEALPDLILCDINLRGEMTGIEIITEINKKYSIPFIYVSAYSNKDITNSAGYTNPWGYITKPFSEKQLLTAVSVFFAQSSSEIEITDREKAVLQLMSNGNATKQIADELNISTNTVESHRKNLRQKFNVNTSTELIGKAFSIGLLKK